MRSKRVRSSNKVFCSCSKAGVFYGHGQLLKSIENDRNRKRIKKPEMFSFIKKRYLVNSMELYSRDDMVSAMLKGNQNIHGHLDMLR